MFVSRDEREVENYIYPTSRAPRGATTLFSKLGLNYSVVSKSACCQIGRIKDLAISYVPNV